jgi:DNA-binding transcriptional ArsR family regulator
MDLFVEKIENEKTEKSLQNLTLSVEPFDVIRHLLNPEYYITQEDIARLNLRERELLSYEVSQRLGSIYNPQEYELEAKKYENVLIEKSRNRSWDSNHARIKSTIENLLEERGSMPTITELASITSLSRQTISKHLEQFEMGEYLKEEMQMFNIMFSNLMVVLHQSGKEGNINAIKLYAEILEKRNSGGNTFNIKNQQINVMLKELISKNLSNI